MRIAQVAPLYESVPPQLYGGTERVVSYLTEELVRLGHDVTLFASGDSVTRARLEASRPRALRLESRCSDTLAPHIRMLSQVYRRAQEFDIIHCHTDYLGLPLTRTTLTPTIITLHGRLDIPEIIPLYQSIQTYGCSPLVTPNGFHYLIPIGPPLSIMDCLQIFILFIRRGSYLLFLGRISPETARLLRHTRCLSCRRAPTDRG
jgi:hypothetical protein